MPFKVEHCNDEDMARTFEIISVTFGGIHSYIEAAYPAHSTPVGRKSGAKRFLAVKQADTCSNFIKVVDTDSGKMIATAKWNIYRDTIPEEKDLGGDFWENDEDKEYAQVLCREYLIPRRKAIRESKGNIICLDLLTVDPDHQRQGAGRMLVKWGTNIADDLGLMAVVESTDQGRELYESEGFKFINKFETKLPEKWEGKKRKQKFHWMVRPAPVN